MQGCLKFLRCRVFGIVRVLRLLRLLGFEGL